MFFSLLPSNRGAEKVLSNPLVVNLFPETPSPQIWSDYIQNTDQDLTN